MTLVISVRLLLWSRGNIVASHLACPVGSIFRGFSSTVRQVSRKCSSIHPRISLVIIIIKKSFIMCMGGSPGKLSEELVTLEKWKKGSRINCDVCEATEWLENELWLRWSDGKVGNNPSVASPTSQLILQPFRFSYVTGSSLASPGEPPMLFIIHLRSH